MEDQEIEEEFQKLDDDVRAQIEKRKSELSFEVKSELELYPEINQIDDVLERLIDNYKVLRKLGQLDEAAEAWEKIKQIKFEQKHLILVMNLDFDRPMDKLKKMASESNIDLKDTRVLLEFRLIQK